MSLDGEKKASIIYPPYTATLGEVKAGKHRVDITAYISRQNSFGAFHHANRYLEWKGPGSWFSKNEDWTYEYRLCEQGIITTPEFFVKK